MSDRLADMAREGSTSPSAPAPRCPTPWWPDEVPAAWWFVGGRKLQRPSALLEISITAGTNTAAQKARFVEAAYAELQRQLA